MKIFPLVLLVLVVLAGGLYVARGKRSAPKMTESTAMPQGAVETGGTTPGGFTSSGGRTTVSGLVSTTLSLTISTPVDGATVKSSSIVVKGKTKAHAEVFVNDAETKADANGNFSVAMTLDEGDNPIVVSANDADGNVAEKELIVYYESGQ